MPWAAWPRRARRSERPVKPYTATTRGVRVTVRAFYLEDQSEPATGQYVWAYKVEIANDSEVTVQLLKRTWLITDGQGRTMRVHGDGVVGEQPILDPGESFDYTSGTPLPTPSGFMRGIYHMQVTDTGEAFDALVPPFSLDSPHQEGGVH
ncbi:MAG: Co2+/Mg2+ efflux protein ApaG [Rubritepida sp.]|nr:Co2+/Mg2+ efflux protein ApaG [Rubritepida sp.]